MTTIHGRRGELDSSEPIGSIILQMMRDQTRMVAIGVRALVVDRPGHLEIRGVMAADDRLPGAVGKWLDGLPRDRDVVVPAITSDRLAGMLERRGFEPETWWDPDLNSWDKGAMIRRARRG